jgi:hypothetical protein
LEVLSQWKQGIVYPRWADLAHFGYGEPRFIFYPPASWVLGAVLSAIFPWIVAVDIYIWIALVAAGVSMFYLARQWLDRRDATFAAVLYAVNPYHIVIVYWRSAFAELLASSLLPLLLLLLLRACESRISGRQHQVTVPLAVVFACAWLTNAPAAVMVHYSAALLALLLAYLYRSPRVLFIAAAAVALGAALASFYLLPAIYEQRWVDIAQAVSAGSRPAESFLFIHTTDPDHDAFNRIVSWVAVSEFFVTALAAWCARRWRKRNPVLWYALGTWSLVCAVLMLPVSSPLWNILPKLQFMQFPWRWMLCMGVPFSLLVTFGIRRWLWRGVCYAVLLCVIALVWHHYQAPWWETADDLREIQDNVSSHAGYEGTDEYTPLGADASAVNRTAPQVTVEGSPQAPIKVTEWQAERKAFTANLPAPGNFVLHLFDYPAWSVKVNGYVVHPATREDTGQVLAPAQPGENQVEISFRRTWDRTLGGCISLLALIIVLLLKRIEFSRLSQAGSFVNNH